MIFKTFKHIIKNRIKYQVDLKAYRCVSSTNDLAKENNACFNNAVFVALRQKNGRGKLNRSFYSPKGGLYLSILLHPQKNIMEMQILTQLAAVATVNAIKYVFDINTYIKWVNDIYYNNKKICGILCESSVNFESTDLEDYSVVGIGINLTAPKNGFPKDIENTAGALFNGKCSKKQKGRLAAHIVNNFFKLYNNLPNTDFLKEYKEKSILINKPVIVKTLNDTFSAVALDIDENSNLIVNKNGEIIKLNSADVSVKQCN